MATFQGPSDEQVREVLRRIPTAQLRRAFFEGLKNPLWVAPLAKEGVFKNPPEPDVTEDGLIRDVYWPEIEYLIHVAPDAPETVVDVLLKLGRSNNAWVKRGVFAIGATIPADQAARLAPLIKAWQTAGFGWRTDPREIVALALNLLQGGQYEVGRWFASLIFKPSGAKGRRKPDFVLEDYWYEEGLPRLVTVLGDDGLALVLPWLVAYERYNGHLTKQSDLTYFSRESIRSSGDSHDSVEQVLIDAVRDLAVKAMLVDAQGAKDMLLGSNMLLGRKIALFSLGEAIRQIGAHEQGLQSLLTAAGELLFDDRSREDSCRIDYAELARAVAHVSPESLEPLGQFIEQGSRADDERVRQRMGRDGADEAEVDERIHEYDDRWKHRWLSAIGAEALAPQLQSKLSELDSKYGVIRAPLEPTQHVTTWSGPNSPISQDEMSAMSPTELVAHLESWRDKGDGRGPEPSHEGQGRELTALITTNPHAVDGVNDLAGRLRPTYLRAILRGWEAALKADLEPEWTQIAELVGDVLGHSDESAFPTEGGLWEDDVNLRLAKQAAVGLLEELAKKRDSFTVPEESMARFAQMLITLAADETAWSEYIAHDKDGGMDPLTISLNWQWPIRIRGLIYLMARGKDATWYEDARSALEAELSRVDSRGASRAVVGESLGRLLSVDPDWLKARVPELFGSATGLTIEQQIALTTALAVHRYHSVFYDLLASPMIGAIRSEEPIVNGWHTQSDPLQRIGEWTIDAIIYGHATIDDPVAFEFFSVAPAKVRGDALGHIAWAFMHAEIVDETIRGRFADLWDARVAHVRAHPEDHEELNGFFWFVKSNKFPVEWWLPRLRQAAILDPLLSAERYMIGKEIASSADVDPRAAFDVLKLLLEGRDEAGMAAYDLTRNAVPMVIAKAIDSGDDDLRQEAVAYMNQLGEKGNLSLESEVNKVLDGEITQSDVDD